MNRIVTRACCALALSITLACAAVALWAGYGFDGGPAGLVAVLDPAVVSLASLLFTGVGVLIVLRGRGHVIGRLQVLTGLALAANLAGYTVGDLYRAGVRLPLAQWATWFGSWSWTLMLLGIWLTLLTFPDGRVTGRLARATLVVSLACTAVLLLVLPFATELPDAPGVPNPVPPVPVLTALSGPVYAAVDPLLYALFPVSVICVGLRYRTSGPDVRAQIRWLAWVALLIVLGITAQLVLPSPWYDVVEVVKLFTVPLLPVVLAVSVLRYRLYDVDRLLSRTVAYALLTGLLATVYVGVVALAGAVVPDWSGSLGVAAATLAAVSLVRPLRRILQDAVDRRFDRARHDAHHVVAGYADRLRVAEPGRDHEADLLHVLDRTVAPTTAWLWQPRAASR